jgi:adenylate cyclase
MGIEIERKYLLRNNGWQSAVTSSRHVKQAYLSKEGGFTARVRISNHHKATLTIKSNRAGLKRLEFEYDVPVADAEQLMQLGQGTIIEKVRHIVPWQGLEWEVDVFAGANKGLIVAEIELEREDQKFTRPDWLGREVTREERYYNSNLATTPFSQWPDARHAAGHDGAEA